MGIHLPDDLREALKAEGLSDDDVLLMTGDELRQVIGGELTYELAVALAGQRRAFANYPGREGRVPQDDLIERNLDMLKLRIVDGLTYAAIAREVDLSKARVPQILHVYYGVDVGPQRPRPVLRVPASDVPVLRAALVLRMRELAEDLDTDAWKEAFEQMRDVYYLAQEVAQDGEDVEMYAGGSRQEIVTKALRDYPRDRAVRERLLEAMPR
jgi:hypothetical protein